MIPPVISESISLPKTSHGQGQSTGQFDQTFSEFLDIDLPAAQSSDQLLVDSPTELLDPATDATEAEEDGVGPDASEDLAPEFLLDENLPALPLGEGSQALTSGKTVEPNAVIPVGPANAQSLAEGEPQNKANNLPIQGAVPNALDATARSTAGLSAQEPPLEPAKGLRSSSVAERFFDSELQKSAGGMDQLQSDRPSIPDAVKQQLVVSKGETQGLQQPTLRRWDAVDLPPTSDRQTGAPALDQQSNKPAALPVQKPPVFGFGLSDPLRLGGADPRSTAGLDSLVMTEGRTVAADRLPTSAIPQNSGQSQASLVQARDIAVQLAANVQSGRFEVTLIPEELGRVKLTLTPADVGHVMRLDVERPEVLETVRRNLDLLQATFSEAGFGQLSFSFSEQGTDDQEPQVPEPSGVEHGENALPITEPSLSLIVSGRLDVRL